MVRNGFNTAIIQTTTIIEQKGLIHVLKPSKKNGLRIRSA